MPRLRVLTGSRHDALIPIPILGDLKLGRSHECGGHLPDDRASRVHARVQFRNDALWIEDLASDNGTWVNGVRQQQVRIGPGDIIQIGGTTLRCEDGTASSDATLVQCLLVIQRLLSRDEEHIIERSIETLFLVLPATRLSLFTVTQAGEVLQGITTTRSTTASGHMSHGFAQRVLAEGRAIILEASTDSQSLNLTMREQNVRTALGVPVLLAGRPAGVLLCDNLDEPGRLGASHLRIMEFAAEALGHVFQRHAMRRLETQQAHAAQEFLAARRVQEQIFTKDPGALHGPMRWSVLYQPALALGGDFYDVNQDELGTTWVVADVSGKGVPAAFVVSLLKAFCKCLYPRLLSPRQLILALDGLLRGEIPTTMFLTIVVIQVAPDGAMVSSAVGHPPILVARADGMVETMDGTQGMLCMWPHALLEERITERRSTLAAGDRVVLFTDGLIEAMDPKGELFEIERVMSQISASRALEPDACLRRIFDDVVCFAAGATWNNDITMVIGGR